MLTSDAPMSVHCILDAFSGTVPSSAYRCVLVILAQTRRYQARKLHQAIHNSFSYTHVSGDWRHNTLQCECNVCLHYPGMARLAILFINEPIFVSRWFKVHTETPPTTARHTLLLCSVVHLGASHNTSSGAICIDTMMAKSCGLET